MKFKQKGKANHFNFNEKTKILIWSTSFKVKENSDTSFYTEFSHRVRKLRRNECPMLKECIFTSNKNRLQKADAIVIISDDFGTNQTDEVYMKAATKEHNLFKRFQYLNDNNQLNLKNKIWSILIRDPFDQRRIKNTTKLITNKFGISHINYYISYMPNADIPLLEFNLTRKVLDEANATLIDTEVMYSSHPTLSGIEKRESEFTKLSDNDISNAASRSRTEVSTNALIVKDSQLSNSNKYTKSGDKNARRAYKIPIYSLFNSNKQLSSSNPKKYAHKLYNKFKKQNFHLNEKMILRVKPNTDQESLSSRKKRGRLNEGNVLNNRRLAAVIMNNCETEGNREGKIFNH